MRNPYVAHDPAVVQFQIDHVLMRSDHWKASDLLNHGVAKVPARQTGDRRRDSQERKACD